MADDLIERLRGTLPVCPFDRRSPDYWTAGKDGAPCTVCGTTEDGPDKCRGADTRCMAEAAAALADKDTALEEMRAEYLNASRDAMEFATKLAAVESQLDRLRKALEPFAAAAGYLANENGWSDSDEIELCYDDGIRISVIPLSAFRAAARALAEGETP